MRPMHRAVPCLAFALLAGPVRAESPARPEDKVTPWVMEKTAAGWKVYDVMVGGISLVANYRTEFANAVRASGIDGLIKDLQVKNRSLEPGKK